MGNISKSHDICIGFAIYFRSNFVDFGENTDLKDKFLNMFDNYCIGNTKKVGDCLFTYNEVSEAVRFLTKNKAPGRDNINAEHLIYAADIVSQPLCELFNAYIVHGFVPSSFIASIIIHVKKDKMDASSFDNYWPISLVSMSSKVSECCLAKRLDLNKNCEPMQFNFTRDRGCQKTLLTVDCVVNYFNSGGSPVYMAALDASKAFDRVKHFSLFIALMKNSVPIKFLRVIIHWHLNLRGLVRLCEQYSNTFFFYKEWY